MASIRVSKPSEEELQQLGALQWPIWSCEVSTFDWHYDQKEVCYVLAGQVTVAAGDEQVEFGPGDLVVFPEGLDCVWQVREPVKKHYKLG